MAEQKAIIVKLQDNISKYNQSSEPVDTGPSTQGGSYLPTPAVLGIDIATPSYVSLGTSGLGQNSQTIGNFDLGIATRITCWAE